MQQTDGEKYLVRKPMEKGVLGARDIKEMIYMSNEQVAQDRCHVLINWMYGVPVPNPCIHEHVHDYDQIILNYGLDSSNPQVLGADVEYYIGGQPIDFNTSSGIYIPKGVKHGPVKWNKVDRPYMQIVVTIGTGNTDKIYAKSGINEPKTDLPRKDKDFDYETYVIRSPLREVAVEVTNRQMPTMTYMSGVHIPGVKFYSEFGWIYDMPDPNPHVMGHVHQNFDELVFHIGADPDNPEDLGAAMEIGVDGTPIPVDTSNVFFFPRGLEHGPNVWQKVSKPHLEGTVMLGAGTFAEASPAGL
ncbi:MAG: hypothetical protein SVV67_07865 [Bacillota bacterium]|nr:hypothetical protein [Bacillota bacterium]